MEIKQSRIKGLASQVELRDYFKSDENLAKCTM